MFITDGIVDTGDRQRDREKKRWLRESLAAEASAHGVRIYGIAFSEEADVELIQALALSTGGEYYRVLAAADIAPVIARIGRSLARGGDAMTAERLREPPPPVGAAPRDRTRGLVLLALGSAVAALLVLYSILERRRRFRPAAHAPIGPSQMPVRSDGGASGSRTGSRPVARMVDVGNVSIDGLLPIPIDRRRTSIGRDETNDVVIRRDTISSFHATIDYADGYFYVEDHRSTNGTSLNGDPLEPNVPVQLKSGDRIDFGAYEFRFIIPDHEPRGRTVVLDGTAHPAEAPFEGTVASPHAETDGGLDPSTSWRSAFDRCLGEHLEKIRAVGEDHRAFVVRHFTPELCKILSRRAASLIDEVAADGDGHHLDLSRQGVHYTLCALPVPIEEASAWFRREHGGYAHWLAELLETWAGGSRRCEAVCVVTFGMCDEAWLSVTIVPARDDVEAVEVMSFEFLSEEERRRALSLEIAAVGRDEDPDE